MPRPPRHVLLVGCLTHRCSVSLFNKGACARALSVSVSCHCNSQLITFPS